jgi:flagellar M-ring protein FliF
MAMATGTQLEKSALAVPGQIQPGGRWAALWGMARVRWAEMAPTQRGWVATAVLLLIGVVGGLAWNATRPDWRTLYVGLDPDDVRQIEQVLAQAQISFDPTPDGAGIRVPAAQLDKARLATAAQGGTKRGRLGFEIFDKPNWVGSEFDEQVNYQRALEGELEHTVGTLADIESARVHLVLPHDSLFREEERPAKASVVLKMRRRTLADGEPEAIRNLVASAVDGLTPDRVVLVDAAGNEPLGPRTAEATQLSAEQALEEKLVATLEPVTGLGNVRASVTLDYDETATEQTQESYDPEKTVTLQMQRSEQTTGPQAVAAGVPGAASNAPNTSATGGLPVYPRQTTAPADAKTESATYGVSKTVRHTMENPGRVRRLTAAIVVNDKLITAASMNRAAVWQPRSAEELRNLTMLAQAAVGFDTSRGDVLTVQDLTFDNNRPQEPVAMPQQILRTAESSPVLVKYMALLLGLLLVVAFGVRPVVRHAGAALASHGSAKNSRALPAAVAPVPLSRPESAEADPDRMRSQEIFDQVTTQLKREPTQSSRLLQSWIHSE